MTFPRDEVVDHLSDCASKAALAALRGTPDAEMRVLLLDQENQRFRFSYVLGRRSGRADNGAASVVAGALDALDSLHALDDFGAEAGQAGEDDNGEDDAFEAEPEGLAGIDLEETAGVLDGALATLRALVEVHAGAAKLELTVASADDERVAAEILDEELDKILRSDERFNGVVDGLLDEIEKRFDALTVGTVARDRQGWPATWAWESDDRAAFLRAVNRFSSNYAPMFGHLLSPLVNGLRVAGTFRAAWLDGPAPRLVLIDGEGLGHTPKSAAALPTGVVKLIEVVDAVLLVDNAAQPMQAAPTSAIRSMLTSGSSDKIIFCFTLFDTITGDNLGITPSARARHVLESAENLLSSISDEFNPRSERALRRRLDGHRVFLGSLDRPLNSSTPAGLKFRWKPVAGVHSQLWEDAQLAAGFDPVFHRRDLADVIEAGAFPKWELGHQGVTPYLPNSLDDDLPSRATEPERGYRANASRRARSSSTQS